MQNLCGPALRTRRGGHGGGELPWTLHREKVSAGDVVDAQVGEELVEPVGPLDWKQWVVFGPQHRRRHVDSGHFLPLERPPEFAAAVAAAAGVTTA